MAATMASSTSPAGRSSARGSMVVFHVFSCEVDIHEEQTSVHMATTTMMRHRFRHQHGSSFVRPAKVSFGVDYVTAVRQEYKMNPDFPSEASSSIEWRIKERR